MNPKQRRDKLFKGQTPLVRKIRLDDLRWIYGAYKMNGGDLDQESFKDFFHQEVSPYEEVFMIEDRHKNYNNGWGVIGMVLCDYNGWRLEPHVNWFPWAGKLNIIRATVAFLLYCRYSKDIGVVLIHAPDKDNRYFRGIRKYVTLYPVKTIPNGLPEGKDHLFYLRGKKRGLT